ncbi:MAG: ATP synthase subunit I [Cyanobacteria bacterium REEB444]|nr:ATP synthase subunit I [Cyanobacteria bacterium REEB444]
MADYYLLKQQLVVWTGVIATIVFISVWLTYSFNIALNYLLGAGAGLIYLRLLAKNIERLGDQNRKLGKSQLVIFIGLIIVATQWEQLHILPIFLGFLTYKAAILAYTLQIVVLPNRLFKSG